MNDNCDNWFDTHVHLDLLGPLGSVAVQVTTAASVGVKHFVVPAVDPADWPRLLRTVREVPGAYAALGVHPLAAHTWDAVRSRQLTELLASESLVALGEIGLDGLLTVPAAVQEAALRGQLRLARGHGLPVLLHCRRAFGRLLQILDEEDAAEVGGIFHAFSGSLESALAAIRRGFGISFAGPLTYPGARRGPELLAALPAEWLVLETDAPDQTPHPLRGSANLPEYLPLIGAAMARLRGWSSAETAQLTTANACRILRLPDLPSPGATG